LQLHKGVSALSQQFTEYPGGGVEETLIWPQRFGQCL
jgi:hypothetical protein